MDCKNNIIMKSIEYLINVEIINSLIRQLEDNIGCMDLKIDVSSKRQCEGFNDLHWYTIYYREAQDLITLGRHIEHINQRLLREKARRYI